MVETLEPIFSDLRDRLLRSSAATTVALDEPGNLILKTPWLEPGKAEPAWFAALQLKKNYVSCHLMPLYALPSLRDEIAAELRRRMQGKSCFNFKKADPELFDRLEDLIVTCAAAYAAPASATPH